MKHEKLFDVAVCVLVAALHVGGLMLMMGSEPPKLVIGEPGMQVVSLGDLNLGQASVAAKPKPTPPPEPKPKVEKTLSVKKPNVKADIVEKAKPKPQPQPEPQPQPAQEADSDTSSEGGSSAGGSATSSGGGQAGSGQGETTATHMGGHLRNPKPPYPSQSLENNEQGSVALRVTVEADGRPSSVELVRSSGYPRLDRSALKTVREEYRFIPATRMGMPIRSVYTFNIVFKMPRR